jgi:hypothetical protein
MASKPIRPIRVEGNVAYVTLTQGYVAVIDAADVPLVEGRNWCAHRSRNTVYALTSPHRGRQIPMHRQILDADPALHVDHKDGDGLNNRRSNLRVATVAQNARNRATRRDSSSGVKGVYFDKDRLRWRAAICVAGKITFLGSFSSLEAAAAAYADASARLHGEFGRALLTE